MQNTQDLTTTSSLHLIDEHKVFSQNLLPYIQSFYNSDDKSGLNYHIVSVFGSQSTGKSTLLNKLFGTKFDVMDETKRQQTTKGIWFSHANYIASNEKEEGYMSNSSNIFVLDVEGVDGREKADDKDFERKSALFALATSEVLIINIWEHQVGLYQGANMELLKTVFEVNLSLFHTNRQKCLLLFVIRDFTGMTPLENLSNSLKVDLLKVWDSLNKVEGSEELQLTDFFDLKFVSIAHKHFQGEKFETDIKALGDSFGNQESLISPEYHRSIPIDAWALYSKQVWEQIELNKDLDLPTQQILVARFRCDELSSQSYEEFENEYKEVDFESLVTPEAFSGMLQKLRTIGLVLYDTNASRYTSSVYQERRNILQDKIDTELKKALSVELQKLLKKTLVSFSETVQKAKKSNRSAPFSAILSESVKEARASFISEASIYNHNTPYTFDTELKSLDNSLLEISEEMKLKETASLIAKITKKFQLSLKEKVHDTLSNPSTESWDQILEFFNESLNTVFSKYKLEDGTFDFRLGLSPDSNASTATEIKKSFWIKFRNVIHDFVSEDTVSRILRNKFEDAFRYNEEGLPRLWKSSVEVDEQFSAAKSKTVALLPIFSVAYLSAAGQEIIPDIDIAHEDDYDDDFEDEVSNPHFFAHLLNSKQQSNISNKLKKEMDAIYIEAKRSIISNTTSIPIYMYALLVLLGWNEFMAVLRNPLLFAMVIILSTGFYFAYNTQMLGPIVSIVQAMFEQTKVVAKEKLRTLLLDEDHKRDSNSSQIVEEIELDDLSATSKNVEE
ncbi:hypothetical protein CANARDRAFT_26197 [[Candida] arabinofermentans NRRL YB-2248]|uniref:GB1/RHD3-type G domain-containing protein n=1 Tax=[Candida] arabinofermentans NRRL YB-2248 TaxID=983967 RepID=A0A1E4T8E7_9ASCO|nr:hypothetical protein CANARDRAFT_26197 [[Candida] arabinofermentans NRRL YB-2248]